MRVLILGGDGMLGHRLLLELGAAGPGCCGFAAQSAQVQTIAGPQILLAAENTCPVDKIRRPCRQAASYLGNVE